MSEVRINLKEQKTPVFSHNKIERNRRITPFYSYGITTDRYGNETYSYTNVASYEINLMWLPISSEVDVEQYGTRVNEMLQACLFTDEPVKENDRVEIEGIMYNIVSIKPYPNYRLLIVERVR